MALLNGAIGFFIASANLKLLKILSVEIVLGWKNKKYD